ncbi:TadE/TadG family type IV pilus assembly protein [Nocardioides bruguierae]|uniref:Pilus assembly protein TadG-related protein n=1 Tax=Nocardioides bruguierae TaxID=2945102 RepID=A0A9X2D9H1_9ACTN|nr:pilus assembly protein TadG-related protein [Nocardioides bruguierae]MCM0621272.1 pilus assembly protein TadG-related protein [Nocardioides bruguierae]
MSAPTRALRGAPDRDDRGTATVFVIGLALALMAVAGLVLDGGLALNARMKVADDAEQAARAGAQQIDLATLRSSSGVLRIDGGLARARAQEYLVGRGYTVGSVDVAGDSVTVSATETVPTRVLSLLGIDSLTVSATATAEAVTR